MGILKLKKDEEDISSFDISDKQKCFIIKVKNKYANHFPQENGGNFYSYLKSFKDIKEQSQSKKRNEICSYLRCNV